jgi:DNA processing protein
MLLAILGPRAVGGPRRLTQHLLRSGRQAAWAMITELPASERAAAESEAAAMSDDGVRVLLCDDQAYPDRLRRAPGAPPALFYRGSLKLLDTPAVGICGSRNASSEGLRAARACGADAARTGVTVVSGYAKGVDSESHMASLVEGGITIAVLAEGIGQFRPKRVYRDLPQDNMLVMSQFPPGQRWNVGAAMTRNQVIVGLSHALVVVEAGPTGGTLRAGEMAIQAGRRLLVLGFAGGDPDGNTKLLALGGHRISDRATLTAELRRLHSTGSGGQLVLV